MAQATKAQIRATGAMAIAASAGPDSRNSEGARFGDGWASPL